MDFDPGPSAALAAHFAALPTYGPHATCSGTTGGRSSTAAGSTEGQAALHRVRPRPHRADREPHPRRGRRSAGPGLPDQARADPVLRPRQRLPVRAAPVARRDATPMLAEPAHLAWRNSCSTRIVGPTLQAVVAFGGRRRRRSRCGTEARVPLSRCRTRPAGTRACSHEVEGAITQLRGIVTPDPGGDNRPELRHRHQGGRLRADPKADLPFGVPAWFGDDAWGRKAQPRHNNSVDRPGSDLKHTLIWRAPTNQP